MEPIGEPTTHRRPSLQHCGAHRRHARGHPMRVFFNPYKTNEVWVASFGGGLRVQTF
jgi:hypothetical protein